MVECVYRISKRRTRKKRKKYIKEKKSSSPSSSSSLGTKSFAFYASMCNCLPEDEFSRSKHIDDIINYNISLTKVHFVGCYYAVIILIA
jgi:hypothetical protein